MKSYKNITIYVMIFCLTFFHFQNYLAKDLGEKVNLKQGNDTNIIIPSSLFLSNYYNNVKNKENPNLINLKEIESQSSKSPWVAFVLSFFIPGSGQMYNGQVFKGLAFMGAYLLGLGLAVLSLMGSQNNENNAYTTTGLTIAVVSYLWQLFDAPITANSLNERNKQISIINQTFFENNSCKINFSAGILNNKYNVGLTMKYGL